jgi:hypothetical protein
MTGLVSFLPLVAVLLAAAPPDARNAKALFFDRRYSEARAAWEEIRRSGQGLEAQVAAYWIARSSESLGEHERALTEYAVFLASGSQDQALCQEARTHRIDLAARLAKEGRRQHLPIVRDGLADANPSVRYCAAFALAGLGPELGQPAVPVLKDIVAHERDPDVLDRAKLALLRIAPEALQGGTEERLVAKGTSRAAKKDVRWIRVRIYEKGKGEPSVSLNLPLALGELVAASLPEDARRELSKKGMEGPGFWERLRQSGPTKILEVDDGEGGKVEIWTE